VTDVTRLTYFAGVSLDGRIAGPNDDLSYLRAFDIPEGEYNLWTLARSFDSMIAGAGTFRYMTGELGQGRGERHEWPYGSTPLWVMTHAAELAHVPGAVLHLASGDPAAVLEDVRAAGAKHTWLIGGANLAGQFFERDLVDELILGYTPVILGAGPSLAEGTFPFRTFELKDVHRFGSGVTLRYERVRSSTPP
jgi:dihydrofolate reductase